VVAQRKLVSASFLSQIAPNTQLPLAAIVWMICGPASVIDSEPASKLATVYCAVRRRSPDAFRDVAQISCEDRFIGDAESSDRQLDEDLDTVCAHGGNLDPPTEHWPLSGGKVMRETFAMPLAK
jgi:hypothetical protein